MYVHVARVHASKTECKSNVSHGRFVNGSDRTHSCLHQGPIKPGQTRGRENTCALKPWVLRGLERVRAATVSPQEAALTFDVVILSRRHQSWLRAHWCGSDSRWPSAPKHWQQNTDTTGTRCCHVVLNQLSGHKNPSAGTQATLLE